MWQETQEFMWQDTQEFMWQEKQKLMWQETQGVQEYLEYERSENKESKNLHEALRRTYALE